MKKIDTTNGFAFPDIDELDRVLDEAQRKLTSQEYDQLVAHVRNSLADSLQAPFLEMGLHQEFAKKIGMTYVSVRDGLGDNAGTEHYTFSFPAKRV